MASPQTRRSIGRQPPSNENSSTSLLGFPSARALMPTRVLRSMTKLTGLIRAALRPLTTGFGEPMLRLRDISRVVRSSTRTS